MIDRVCEFVFGNHRKMEQNAARYLDSELRIQKRGIQRFGGFVYVSSGLSIGALIWSIVSKGAGSGLEFDGFLIAAASLTYLVTDQRIENTIEAINTISGTGRRKTAFQKPVNVS